jgi:hypothetical protein
MPYVFFAQKQKDAFRKSCYYDLPELQKNLVQSEKKLFALNPESTALRLRLKMQYAELAIAIASENVIAAAKIELEIQQTMALQEKLDKVQRLIINTANNYLNLKLISLQHDLNSYVSNEVLVWSHIVNQAQKYQLGRNMLFAVEPDVESNSVGGLAPNYFLRKDYISAQQLDLVLQFSLNNNLEHQNVLQTQQQFKFFCKVSFTKKENLWELKINQDKFL